MTGFFLGYDLYESSARMVHAQSPCSLIEDGVNYSASNALKINDFWSVRCNA